jgi:hypothetical protein
MLVSTTFDRVITMLGLGLPWIAIGIMVFEGLLRTIPAPSGEGQHVQSSGFTVQRYTRL